jgi:hypothetical protein
LRSKGGVKVDIAQAIEELKELQKDCIHEEGYQALRIAIKELLHHRVYEVKNKKIFEWIKCKRKNGTEFLKLIYYRYESDGYAEVGRFNMTKDEIINNEWSIDEILKELN